MKTLKTLIISVFFLLTMIACTDENKNFEPKQIESILALNWFGGEPLLYFDEIMFPLSKTIKEMTENNGIIFQNSITTNGYLMDKDRIEKFSEIGLNDFQITLDGDEITHNNIRFTKNGGGSFRRIIENINYLSGFDANTIVVRIN